MPRLLVLILLTTHLTSGLTAVSEAEVWLDPESDHAGYELHILPHPDDVTDEEADHHFCHHNLVGFALIPPVPDLNKMRAERLLAPPALYRFEYRQRLLRPPRR